MLILKKENTRAGFTLIEVIMVLFFAGILITVLFGIYDWHSKIYYYQQALVRVSTSARSTVQAMQFYTSQANRVLASASVNGAVYSSGADTVVMQLPSTDADNNVLAGKWDKAVFYLSESNLYMRLEPDALSSRSGIYKLLAENVSGFTITYNNADFNQVTAVTINLSCQLLIKNQLATSSFRQNIYLKNY